MDWVQERTREVDLRIEHTDALSEKMRWRVEGVLESKEKFLLVFVVTVITAYLQGPVQTRRR